jgi:hypothetical protein
MHVMQVMHVDKSLHSYPGFRGQLRKNPKPIFLFRFHPFQTQALFNPLCASQPADQKQVNQVIHSKSRR